jgi:putative membrane protein
MGGMMGAWMILWGLVSIAVLVLAVIGGMWAVRALSGRDSAREPTRAVPPPKNPAQAELRRRYAAGEITREEFLQGKVDLE